MAQRQRLKPLLFDFSRPSIVAPAELAPSSPGRGTLLDDLATVANNRVVAPLAEVIDGNFQANA